MTNDERIAVMALHKLGNSISSIARTVGLSEHSVRCVVSPDYVEKCRKRDRERRQLEREITGFSKVAKKIDPVALRKAINSIPADTRNLTQRLLGDPLPGRSALDMRGGRT